MPNINQNTVVLIDANGLRVEYREVPDLRHIAIALEDGNIENLTTQQKKMASKAILDTWLMAHDLKDAITQDRKARIVGWK